MLGPEAAGPAGGLGAVGTSAGRAGHRSGPAPPGARPRQLGGTDRTARATLGPKRLQTFVLRKRRHKTVNENELLASLSPQYYIKTDSTLNKHFVINH